MNQANIDPKHVSAIQRLAKSHKPLYDGDWLDTDNPSVAFVICVAMGPWKDKRRFDVANRAIDWLMESTGPNLIDLRYANASQAPQSFPLEWQQRYLANMIRELQVKGITFRDQIERWRNLRRPESWAGIVHALFYMCGAKPNGSKVLWLFARDVLQVPAFAVDRWVARNLKKAGLPSNPWYLAHACLNAGVSPNELSRALYTARDEL